VLVEQYCYRNPNSSSSIKRRNLFINYMTVGGTVYVLCILSDVSNWYLRRGDYCRGRYFQYI